MNEQIPLHVAIIIPNTDLNMGGAERQVVRLLSSFENNERIKIALFSKHSEYKPASSNIEVYNVSRPGKIFGYSSIYFILSATLRLIKLHREKRVHIINAHMLGISALPALLMKKIFKIPVVIKISGDIDRSIEETSAYNIKILGNRLYKKAFAFLIKYILKNTDYFQVINESIRDDLINRFKIKPGQLIMIPNGIPVKGITFRKDLKEINRFGFVGRLEPIKKLHVLLEAFRMILNTHVNAKLIIYGHGSELKMIRGYILQHRLGKSIQLKGVETNQHKMYSSFDAFVLTSGAEGISNSLLEAMAYGLPVIISEVPGNIDVIKNDFNGLLFPPDSPEDLCAQMLRIMKNPGLVKKIRTNARKNVEEIYEIDRITSQLIHAYEKIIK